MNLIYFFDPRRFITHSITRLDNNADIYNKTG